MMLQAAPLTQDAFAPFGDVLEVPREIGRRAYFDRTLVHLRPQAPASLSLILASPAGAISGEADTAVLTETARNRARRPVVVHEIERHAFSSQSFLPLAACRWVVVVAPDGPDHGPDLAGARAFLPAPGQAITLKAGTWHAPLTVLDRPAPFAILMWRDGGALDDEFRAIPPLPIET